MLFLRRLIPSSAVGLLVQVEICIPVIVKTD